MKFGRFLVLTAATSLLLASQTQAGDKRKAEPAMSVPIPAATPTVDYKIGPNDTLDITVFQVPDLTRTVQVDTGGNIMLPLVGKVSVIGRTANELSDSLKAQLEKSYMKNALVTVTVKEMTTHRVTVDGAVNQPGVYPLAGPTSLMQAVALARGPDTHVANLKRVVVFRGSDTGTRVATVYNLQDIRSGKAPDPEVHADDIVVVDSSGVRSFVRDFSNAFPLITWLRPY
jgi:polysaccharide biosynthesis/export protein